MKEFRKINENLFICEECNKTFTTRQGIGNHIGKNHNQKEYYDKWLKEENEGLCKICGKEAKFRNFSHGYNFVCDNKYCLNKFKYDNLYNGMIKKYSNYCSVHVKELHLKQQKTCIKKYEHYSALGNKKIYKKGKQTKKEKYGNENYNNREKNKETCLKKYGVESVFQYINIQEKIQQTNKEKYKCNYYIQSDNFKEKSKKTNLEKYECDYYIQSDNFKEKSKKTNLEKYGVEYNLQNKEIFKKQQKSALKLKQYKNTNIYYRGSYELDFLEKVYPLYSDIQNAKSIKYLFKNKNHYYFPDFYIPSLNLIIECKNSYLIKRDKEKIEAKENATIVNGFNYIIIVDKNYINFDKKLFRYS
jgi:hypothetical protein